MIPDTQPQKVVFVKMNAESKMRNILAAFAIWAAGLGAAAQFGKMSVVYQQLGDIYPDHRGVGIGIMVSIIGIIGLIFGATAGMLVSRVGPRRAMLGALALGAGVSLFQSLILPFPLMLASRVLEGFSHLAIVVVGPTAIAATANARFQGLVMTLWGSFFGVSFATLAYFGPGLVAISGPGLLFQAHAAWLVFCLAILSILMPTDPPKSAAPKVSILAQHLDTYRSPWIAAPATGFVCYTVTYVAILTLLPGAVGTDWGHSTAVAMPLVSILVSLTLGVWLLGRMTAVRVVQAGFVAVIVATVGLWMTWGQGATTAVFACWIAAAMGVVQGASFASIPQLNVLPTDRARAAGAIAQLGNVGTTSGTPALALILSHFGISGMALFLMAFATLGIALHSWQAGRRSK